MSDSTIANVTAIRPAVAADLAFIRSEVQKSKGVSEGTIVRFDRVKRRRIRSARTISETVEFEELVTTYAAPQITNAIWAGRQ